MTRIIVISIVIAILGCVPLMGIPGGILLYLSKPFVNLIYGPMAYQYFEQSLGPSTWSLALIITILWPISIPLAYGLTQKLFGPLPFFSLSHLLPFCIFVLIGSTIISCIVVSTNTSIKRLSDTEVLNQALKEGDLGLVKKHWDEKNHAEYAFGDPLFIALDHRQAKIADYLLDHGVSPQKYAQDLQTYEPGLSPLHTATHQEMFDVTAKLLELGVSPNIRSSNGLTPLHVLGMSKNTLEIMKLLHDYNADFTAIDNEGNSALIRMVMINAPLEHRPMLIRNLIAYGCPLYLENKAGQTALSIAQEQQSYDRELIAALTK